MASSELTLYGPQGGAIQALPTIGGASFLIRNLNEKKSKSLLFFSAGAGARLGGKVPAKLISERVMWVGGMAGKGADIFGNPFDLSPPINIYPTRAFSFDELAGAKAVGIGSGTDALVVGTSFVGLSFFACGLNERLFNMNQMTLGAVFGVGLNIVSFQGGLLIDLNPTPITGMEQWRIQDLKERMPEHMKRPLPGKI